MQNKNNEFDEIINMIESRRNKIYKMVNEELISLYWDFGKYISKKIKENAWGTKIIDNLVLYLKEKYPNLKGFNRAGIYRMKQFYETYINYSIIVSTLLRQLNWSSHILILSSTKSIEEKEFYIKLAIKQNYSTRELSRQIKSSYYERYSISNNINNEYLLCKKKDINSRFLDIYSFEFLNLMEGYDEKELRKEIINHLKQFILEIGKDFSFVGDEYRISVGNDDFYIDLLFYNRELNCLVAFELKIGKFKPEYVSKMNFYLEILDKTERKRSENPSIGIILCASKDNEVVKYAVSRNISPLKVSTYTLKLIDKKLLEDKLKEISYIVDNRLIIK